MLYYLLQWLANEIFPTIEVYAIAGLNAIVTYTIIFIGIAILLSSAGVKISSEKLINTTVSGCFEILGIIIKNIFKAIGWIINLKLISKIYSASKKLFMKIGCRESVATVCSVLVILIIL